MRYVKGHSRKGQIFKARPYLKGNDSLSAKIPLTRGMFSVVDKEDADRLCVYAWHVVTAKHLFYAKRKIPNTPAETMSRVILQLTPEDKRCIDHINGDTLDNRKCNLRICEFYENSFNRKTYRTNTSGYKGVTWSKDKEKWQPQIQVRGKRKHLGYFDDPLDAHLVYLEASRKYFGDFERKS